MIRTSRGARRRHHRGGHSVLEAAGGGHSARGADQLRLGTIGEYGERGPRVLVQDTLRSETCHNGGLRVHPAPLALLGAVGEGRGFGLAPVASRRE